MPARCKVWLISKSKPPKFLPLKVFTHRALQQFHQLGIHVLKIIRDLQNVDELVLKKPSVFRSKPL